MSTPLAFALRSAIPHLTSSPFTTGMRHFSTRSLFPVASSSRSHLLPFARTAHMMAYSHSDSKLSSESVPLGLPADPDVKGKGKETSPIGASIPAKNPPPKRRSVNLKAKKAAITVTPAALLRLKALLATPGNPQLIRISVKNRGCAGMAYHLEYVPPPGAKFDEVVEQDGVRVLIDSKALFSIIGSEMDWQDDALSSKFVFNNPNIKEACGCGESWMV